MTKIGFVGLGHMGNPMAQHLITAGCNVKVFDIVPEAVTALVKVGAKAGNSLADIADDADVIITMLQTSQQVSEACLKDEGLFARAKKNTLFIDCSSIDIVTSRQLHNIAKIQDIAMLDAPVSGGVAGAEAGGLTFMVGGSAENFQRGLEILTKMGKKIVHAGEAGAGQAAKICNNLILGISMIAVSEAFALGKKLGLDTQKFFEISSNASGQCWSMTSYCPEPGLVPAAPSNHDYKAGFMSKMMLKDLRLAQHAAESVNSTIPLGAEAAEIYSMFVNQGNGEVDFSGIIKMFK